MPKYAVEFIELISHVVTVEAEDMRLAQSKAKEILTGGVDIDEAEAKIDTESIGTTTKSVYPA